MLNINCVNIVVILNVIKMWFKLSRGKQQPLAACKHLTKDSDHAREQDMLIILTFT